jgi:hypothetical protein
MKKIFLFLGLLISVYSANSQVLISIILGDKLNTGKIEFGLEGGWNWSNLRNLEGANTLGNFNLGFYFDIKTKNPDWMVSTGVIVKSSMGAAGLPVYTTGNAGIDTAFKGGEVTRKTNYFNVPIMMKYKFSNHFYAKGGIMLGLGYKAYDQFSNTVNEKEDLNYKIKINEKFHPIDAGFAVGLGYRLLGGNGMNLGIQYYVGMIDAVVNDASPNQYNRCFYLTAGIPIGKGKAEKKAKAAEEK